jgi:hypothetical protein
MNDLQSLVNIIIIDKFFSKLLGYKVHLPEDNICLDNTASNNSDIHTIEYLNAYPQHMGYYTVLMEQRATAQPNAVLESDSRG